MVLPGHVEEGESIAPKVRPRTKTGDGASTPGPHPGTHFGHPARRSEERGAPLPPRPGHGLDERRLQLVEIEAARLEGATPWQRFWLVTFPLLRPVSLYLLVTGIIWSFQVFALVYVMTEGGPARSTDVLVYQIYQNAWEFRRMGYASAMSWVLFALLIGLTLLQWRWLNRRIEHAA